MEIAKVARPPLKVPLPKVVVPSRNVTVPVDAEGETVAVNVTDCPDTDGFTLDVTLAVVPVLVAGFTTCDTAEDVLGL